MAKKSKLTEEEAEKKVEAVRQIMYCEDYMILSVAPQSKGKSPITDIYISNTEKIKEAMKNLVRTDSSFYNLLVEVVDSEN